MWEECREISLRDIGALWSILSTTEVYFKCIMVLIRSIAADPHGSLIRLKVSSAIIYKYRDVDDKGRQG